MSITNWVNKPLILCCQNMQFKINIYYPLINEYSKFYFYWCAISKSNIKMLNGFLRQIFKRKVVYKLQFKI